MSATVNPSGEGCFDAIRSRLAIPLSLSNHPPAPLFAQNGNIGDLLFVIFQQKRAFPCARPSPEGLNRHSGIGTLHYRLAL